MMDWIKRTLSEGDGTPSSKRQFFLVAVIACIAFAGWDTWKAKALTQQGVALLNVLTGACSAAYIGGRLAEAKTS